MVNPRAQFLAKRAAQVLCQNPTQTPIFVPSPCMSVCAMDPQTASCEGCFRNLDEIGAWSQMTNEAKREVWQRIAQRVSALPGV